MLEHWRLCHWTPCQAGWVHVRSLISWWVPSLVLPSACSQAPRTDFHNQYVNVKWHHFVQGYVPFGGPEKNYRFRPYFPLKTQIFYQFLTGLTGLVQLVHTVMPLLRNGMVWYRCKNWEVDGRSCRSCGLTSITLDVSSLLTDWARFNVPPDTL